MPELPRWQRRYPGSLPLGSRSSRIIPPTVSSFLETRKRWKSLLGSCKEKRKELKDSEICNNERACGSLLLRHSVCGSLLTAASLLVQMVHPRAPTLQLRCRLSVALPRRHVSAGHGNIFN